MFLYVNGDHKSSGNIQKHLVIAFSKMFKGKGQIFCVATRERVWDVPVLASHLKNAKSILQYPRRRRLKSNLPNITKKCDPGYYTPASIPLV